ncbi:hypothetical protein CHGG_00264 [Chaetomium globosum CBS 148.51]|uniref:Uncharacterized protein n=1 Tax=Chaetomium globosum (strain ATCC 6205 / CBS 148.51 / DSM 1962 / NBRC 6347 / NRRL 1970) TaxID=306901 RepID=Q2HHP0_CHAGB|nr:uncharacterized protein CHGG_00264 [Chaetomium globosum CBS 148.51]EAQ92029.1 hypothetical protein CHGG_00264 [Chaetomium globosum CBS 148.51]
MLLQAALFSLGAVGALAHAVVKTPTPRKAGALSEELCGAAVSTVLNRDLAGPIENAVEVADADYNCNAYVCRGYQYKDNEASLHTFQAGDIVDFHIVLVAGHRPGYANVSVIDPVNNVVLGSPLKTWEEWPINSTNPIQDDVDFNITIPERLASICTEGGKCAIQWYWYAIRGSQTYESCVDFVIVA